MLSLDGVHSVRAVQQTVIDTDSANTFVSPPERKIPVSAGDPACTDLAGDNAVLNIIQDDRLVFCI